MTATETAPADVPAPAAQGLRSAVPRLYLVCAVVAFALGSIAYGATAAKLVWPEFLSGEAILAYGRLLPAASNVLVLGWLTLGLAGAAIWLAPRLGGARPAGQLTLPGLLLIIGGLGGGVVAVLAGENAGGRYLELPWWADVAVAAGLAAVAVAVTRALRSAAGALPLSAWYLIAGLWVQLAGVATGVIPGLDGVSVALQGRFAASVITFAGPVLIGLGVAYFLVGALAQETEFHPRLGSIGFWSLLFSLLWMAPRDFQNGPTPDWLETVPVLLGAVLTVAAVTIAADFAHALRGKWPAVAESRSLRLSVLGVALVPVTAAVLFVSSLRGPSAVLHFTLWEGGIEVLVLFGAGTMFLLAAVHHAVPKGRPFPVLLGVFQVWAFPAGLAAVLVSRWIGGLQQGYTWVGSVGLPTAGNQGESFRNSVVPLEGLQITQVAGLALLALAGLALLAGSLIALTRRPVAVPDLSISAGTGAPLRTVLAGTTALFLVAALAVVILPAAGTEGGPSLLAEASRPTGGTSMAALGRDLYVGEGCWYCHTQQVRGIVTDVGLGPVSVVGDYANDGVDLLGSMRIGPDLTHPALRELAGNASALADHLADPRIARPWSTMPSFDYLTESERAALAAYVAGLE